MHDRDDARRLKAEAQRQERDGAAVVGALVIPGAKNPPPPGIAYSANFSRFQRQGIFANQVRE